MGASFFIPAALAAVSAGGQYANESAARSRADEAEAQAIRNQDAIRQEGVGKVQKTIASVAGDTPDAIAGKATGAYVAQLRRNAAGSTQGGPTNTGTQTSGASTSSLAPNTVGSKRYQGDTANAQKEVSDYGNTYAGELGNMDAATRMRQNEGLSMDSLGTQLNLLGAKSFGQNFVDQLRAHAAGMTSPWGDLATKMLGLGANAYAINHVPATDTVSKYARILGNGYTGAGTPVEAGSGLTLPPGLV